MLLVLLIVAQTTGSPGLDVGGWVAQLGVAGAAVVWAIRAERRAEASEGRERQAQADKIEILERVVPIAIASNEALRAMQTGMQRTVEYARSDVPTPAPGLRDTLERVVDALGTIEQRLPPVPKKRGST